jgi:hypothetical protein
MKIIFYSAAVACISLSFYGSCRFEKFFKSFVNFNVHKSAERPQKSQSYHKMIAKRSNKFTYWPIVLKNWNENGNLRTMEKILGIMGYEKVDGVNEKW